MPRKLIEAPSATIYDPKSIDEILSSYKAAIEIDSAKALLSQLNADGPLHLIGLFGTKLYLNPAVEMRHMGLPMWGWRKGSFIGEESIPSFSDSATSIVIIGISLDGYEKTKQDQIYFIHPEASSICYTMSFENFKERLEIAKRMNMREETMPVIEEGADSAPPAAVGGGAASTARTTGAFATVHDTMSSIEHEKDT